MWHIENPWNVFSYIYERDLNKQFNFMCLVNAEKWQTLPEVERIEALSEYGLQVKNVEIKDPNNPAKLNDAKLITFSLE